LARRCGRQAQIGGPFTLVDQNGAKKSDTDFRGKFMLVYFGYTYCPDVCPLTLGVMDDALAKIGAARARVVPVFITVDPARDTPKVMKSYVAAFGGHWVGLTGSAVEIAKVAKSYAVYYKKQPLKGGGYAMDHSSTIYLMGPDGSFVANYDESLGPAGLAAELKKKV
jgi:protein SCO1/2